MLVLKFLWWVFRVLLFVLLLLLALRNQHTVTVYGALGTSLSWPLAWVLALSLVIGVVLGILAMLPRALQRKPPNSNTPTPPAKAAQPLDDGLGI